MPPAPATTTTGKIFCTHCGKAFTRKEHLERHIPTHTNVKPWRCDYCRMEFSRKDLKSRHELTYHVPKKSGDAPAGGSSPRPGQQPIACQHCASAKTACNKELPCDKCQQRKIVCIPRFARRSSKMAARTSRAAAQPTARTQTDQNPLPHQPQQDPVLHGVNHQLTQSPHYHHPPHVFNNFGPSLEAGVQHNGPNAMSMPAGLAFRPETPGVGQALQFGSVLPNYQGMSQEYPVFTQEDLMNMNLMSPDGQKHEFTFRYDPSDGSDSMGFVSTPSPIRPDTRETSLSGDFDMQQAILPIDQKPLEVRVGAPAGQSAIREFEDVVKAESSWPLARCGKPIYSGKCPRTALTHLTFFEGSSKAHDTWKPLVNYIREHVNWEDQDLTEVVPVKAHTRDSMLAITQKFLQKALEIHGRSGANDGYSGFVVLPPSDIIHYFLGSYVRTLSVYYPLLVSGCVNPNDMLADCRPSTLLLLLMIAQGAAAVPVAEARYLSTGLTEICRISLFDIIEKNVELSADLVALRCALLFTLLGSWSGDKWLMDIAMGQRGMYMSMLKHAGMLDSQPLPVLDLHGNNLKAQQQVWIERESGNRLVYNWVMLDHELSLFHDCAPLLAITELQCPLPAPEHLWISPDSTTWAVGMRTMYGSLSPHMNPQMLSNHVRTPSLSDLFRDFLQNNLSEHYIAMTPQQLRLLLHPIQAMLCHLRHVHSCLPETLVRGHTGTQSVNRDSTEQRIREVQTLLQQWYNLTTGSTSKNTECPLTRCNLVLYHLMYLNTVTHFPEIERLARKEGLDDGSSFNPLELSLRHKSCIMQRMEAKLHSGQVLGLLRQMPRNRRPSWWTAALYRAILVLWVDSLTPQPNDDFKSDQFAEMNNEDPYQQANMPNISIVAIDVVRQDSPALHAWISGQQSGIPVLTKLNGQLLGLDKGSDILDHGIDMIDEADSSRFGDGIRRKLAMLKNSWKAFEPWEFVDTALSEGAVHPWEQIDQSVQGM